MMMEIIEHCLTQRTRKESFGIVKKSGKNKSGNINPEKINPET